MIPYLYDFVNAEKAKTTLLKTNRKKKLKLGNLKRNIKKTLFYYLLEINTKNVL
jgi:hypothetical protein